MSEHTTRPVKLVVFAHTPPPHHGQSYMVELLLRSFAGPEHLVKCFHVNARVSDDLEDVGGIRVGKVLRLLRFCMTALRIRFRHGVRTLYYVPAPAKKSAIARDWIVMTLLRLFFPRLILHWHAVGLGEWVAGRSGRAGILRNIARRITRTLLSGAELSVVLTQSLREDAAQFAPRRIAVIPNGIPDPCAYFAGKVWPERQARLAQRTQASSESLISVHVLFLAHCTAEKGVFDALHAVAEANRRLRTQGAPFLLHLSVAGLFASAEEQDRFEQELVRTRESVPVTLRSFLSGEEKREAFEAADLFLSPSHHESFGLTLVEAMAYGCPCVATALPSYREILPPEWPYLAGVGDVEGLAAALIRAITGDHSKELRDRFAGQFALPVWASRMAAALAGPSETDLDRAAGDT